VRSHLMADAIGCVIASVGLELATVDPTIAS
jgi:hypothetical protein